MIKPSPSITIEPSLFDPNAPGGWRGPIATLIIGIIICVIIVLLAHRNASR